MVQVILTAACMRAPVTATHMRYLVRVNHMRDLVTAIHIIDVVTATHMKESTLDFELLASWQGPLQISEKCTKK